MNGPAPPSGSTSALKLPPFTAPAAVLFDLDGTLADTLADIAAAMNRALAQLGCPPHPAAAYRRFVGEGVTVLAERVLPAGRRAEAEALVERFRDDYLARCCEQTRLYPGIAELLTELRRRRLPLAVLSNKPDDATSRVVAGLFGALPGPFARVCGQRPGWPRKPDPTVALALAAELGAAPQRCWFVGDSAVDMATARGAGMVAVGVLWGFRGREELEAAGAAWLLRQPAELLDRLPPAP